jgi:hypothetical protein
MTPEEDLNYLQTELNRVARTCMSAARDILRRTTEELRAGGYKNHEQAVVGTFGFYQARMDQLQKDYLKKYPDEGLGKKGQAK